MPHDRSPRRLTTQDGTVIATQVGVAESLWSRFMGLMGRSELPAGSGLCIQPCRSIHMFFMRFPIDAVFVDGDGRVVRIYQRLRPWRMTRMVRRARAVIELPAGTAEAAGLRSGDVVTLS